jgi:hypothetical protein
MTKPITPSPTGRDGAPVVEDIRAERAALADAEREIGELQRRRREMLVSATMDEVLEVDRALARAGTAIDIAQAKLGPLEAEFERLRAAARDAYLAGNLKRAQGLREEGQRLIEDYAEHAAAIVAVLHRLAEIHAEVVPLNNHLPSGVDQVQVEPPRDAGATLATAVKLPGVTPYAADFWPTRPRRHAISEVYRTG